MAALNILVEVPNIGQYNIEELKKRLTAYAQQLIAMPGVLDKTTAKKYKHEILCGLLAPEREEDELREEYLQDKYGI